MGEIAVAYLGTDGRKHGAVRIDNSGISMLFGKRHSGGYSWDQVRRISFDDLAGALGVAGSQASSLLTLSVPDQDLLFETGWPIGMWRTMALRIIEDVPTAAGRVFVEGVPVGPHTQSGPADDVFEQIRRLGELRDAGIVIDGEFQTKKADLLSRL
jgi:hypothetical protein